MELQFHSSAPSNDSFVANQSVLQMVLIELIQNALAYYEDNEISKRVVIIEYHTNLELTTISVFSVDTCIDEEALSAAGYDPISNRDSGLGLFMVNKFLQEMGAKIKTNAGRYFSIDNELNPGGVKISFQFNNRTNV